MTVTRARILRIFRIAAVLLVVAPTAAGAAPISVTAWSGALGPGAPVRQVKLSTSGAVTVAAGLGTGALAPIGSVTPTAGQLQRIRQAAQTALGAPVVTQDSTVEGGGYASALITVGSTHRLVIEINKRQPALEALTGALDAVLPTTQRLFKLAAAPTAVAHSAGPPILTDFPTTGGCDSQDLKAGMEPPTWASKDLTFKQAADAGIIDLHSKGKFQGDSVAADFHWKPVVAPVTIHLNIELTLTDGAAVGNDGKFFATQTTNALNALHPVDYNGEPATFEVNAHVRPAGAGPTPCFHQVTLSGDQNLRDATHGAGVQLLPDPTSLSPARGVWRDGVSPEEYRIDPNKDPGAEARITSRIWAHESMHLMGADDCYHDVVVTGGGTAIDMPIPGVLSNVVAGLTNGQVTGAANPGCQHDLMNNEQDPQDHINVVDINRIVADNYYLIIHAVPGDILVNKNAAQGQAQNMGVGAPFELRLRPGEHAHRNGIVAYCLDHNRAIPAIGTGFDVLGNAATLPGNGMPELARVLQAVAQNEPSPLALTPGGQSAVWRVTDNLQADSPQAAHILAQAGVAGDTLFTTPHFSDPNFRSPTTGSVTTTRVIARPRPPRIISIVPRVSRLFARARGFHGLRLLLVRFTLRGSPALITLTLRQGRRVALALAVANAHAGANDLQLLVGRPLRGRYTLVLTARGLRPASEAVAL